MRYIVYQCDKCSTQKISEKLPNEWKVVLIGRDEQGAKNLQNIANFCQVHWCESCHLYAIQPMATEATV